MCGVASPKNVAKRDWKATPLKLTSLRILWSEKNAAQRCISWGVSIPLTVAFKSPVLSQPANIRQPFDTEVWNVEGAPGLQGVHDIWIHDFFDVSRKNGETKCIKIPAKCCKNSIPDSPRPRTSCAAQCRPPYVGQATVAQCPAGNTMMQPLIWTSGSQREGF